MSDTDLGPDLGALYSDREPDPALEARVVADWARVVGVGPGRPPLARPALRAAAAVVLLATGWAAGWLTSRPGPEPGAAHDYMLLLWEGEEFEPGDDPSGFAEEYAAWARGVASSGLAIEGEELARARTWVGPGGAATAPSGTDALRLGGYFLVGAPNADAAVSLALEHPHVRHGGWVEVAPLATGTPPG